MQNFLGEILFETKVNIVYHRIRCACLREKEDWALDHHIVYPSHSLLNFSGSLDLVHPEYGALTCGINVVGKSIPYWFKVERFLMCGER